MTTSAEKETTLKISHDEAKKQILKRVEKVKEIQDMNILGEEQLEEGYRRLEQWKSITVTFLESIFTGSKYVDEFKHFGGMVVTMAAPFPQRQQQLDSWIQKNIDRLEALVGKLPYIPVSNDEHIKKPQEYAASYTPVFVVHGHDEAMNQQVLRFIEKLELKAIDLREQAGGALSIQEKLQKYSDVKFAVILFTADDIGRLKNAQEENPRNRQNVIYELAGFQKQLGKDRVVIIQKEKTELPSDISGVHYISWHDTYDGWKILLARELKNAGLNFDFNQVI